LDPEIDVIAECMGGQDPAFYFAKQALRSDKSVVTANKELVAIHGRELEDISSSQGVSFLYEASVGGGIPIVQTIKNYMQSDNVTEIEGVLNGTTNFILAQMENFGMSFDDALALARNSGYAEADPSADIDGIDADWKIKILSRLAWPHIDNFCHEKPRGISHLTANDIKNAKSSGGAIKLVASAILGRDNCLKPKIQTSVKPQFVLNKNPLAHVDGANNLIKVKGETLGGIVLSGPGAGGFQTAHAVIADVIQAFKEKEGVE